MKIYAVMLDSERFDYAWTIGYFMDRETAIKQIRELRNPSYGDWAYVKEIEVLDKPRDIDLQGRSEGIDFKYYDEENYENE